MRRKLKQQIQPQAAFLITPIWNANIFNSKVNAKAYASNWKWNLNRIFPKILKICTTLTTNILGLTKAISKKWEKPNQNRRFAINREFI